MSRFPRWMDLEVAAIEHGEPVVPFESLPPPRPDVRTQPAAPEVTVADEKTCATCGEALRKGNPLYVNCPKHRTKEETRAAWAASKRKTGGRAGAKPRAPKPDADDQVLERSGLPQPPPKSDALKRFRVVAEAMGYAPDALLAQYCEGWLAAVKQSVDRLEAPGGE